MLTSSHAFFINHMLAALAVLLLSLLRSDFQLYISLVFVIAMGHYVTAFIYSYGRIGAYFSRKLNAIGFLVFCIIAVLAAYHGLPNIVLYFGIHHILTEVFLHRYTHGKVEVYSGIPSNWLRFLLHLCIYISLLIKHPVFRSLKEHAGLVAVTCAGLSILTLLSYIQKQRALAANARVRWQHREILYIDCFWIALWLLRYFSLFKLTFLDIVLYHFIIWLGLPILKISSVKDTSKLKSSLKRYLSVNVCCLAGAFLLSYFISKEPRANYLSILSIDKVGHLHISLTFLVSSLNPAFLSKLLQRGSGPAH